MNKQKQTYLSPLTETLVVRFEGSVMGGGSPYNPDTQTEYFQGIDGGDL